MLSISSPSASLPFVRGATGLRLISLAVMQSLYVVFHVILSKLLNKPAYDVTVLDDLALGGASLLSALRYRPYEVTIPLGWASEGDRAPQFRQRILLFLRCHLTVPHGSGQSRVMAHCVPVYLKQSCWHKFVDAAKTDRIKEVTYQICVCVYNNCWCDVLTVFSKRDKLEIGGVNPLETC